MLRLNENNTTNSRVPGLKWGTQQRRGDNSAPQSNPCCHNAELPYGRLRIAQGQDTGENCVCHEGAMFPPAEVKREVQGHLDLRGCDGGSPESTVTFLRGAEMAAQPVQEQRGGERAALGVT